MASFKHYPRGSLVGDGTYKFRHFGEEAAEPQYLCFTAEEENSTITMQAVGSAPSVSLETSPDGVTWTPFTVGTTIITLASVGDKVYFRGDNTGFATDGDNLNRFVMTGKIAASGNIQSLIDKTMESLSVSDNCYRNIFRYCVSLTTAPELPATTFAADCYRFMFGDCTSLTTAPELPATTLAASCYQQMFNGCTSLVTAPELPATTLAASCYQQMFNGCTSLVAAPELPATTMEEGCYQQMFSGCTSLVAAPELPATTLAANCYSFMFNGCTSLTTAPELPATTLATECYRAMFQSCRSLTGAIELPATTLAVNCYQYMFNGCGRILSIKLAYTGNFSTYFLAWVYGVSSSGDFYYNGSDTTRGQNAIPTGWTVHTF